MTTSGVVTIHHPIFKSRASVWGTDSKKLFVTVNFGWVLPVFMLLSRKYVMETSHFETVFLKNSTDWMTLALIFKECAPAHLSLRASRLMEAAMFEQRLRRRLPFHPRSEGKKKKKDLCKQFICSFSNRANHFSF